MNTKIVMGDTNLTSETLIENSVIDDKATEITENNNTISDEKGDKIEEVHNTEKTEDVKIEDEHGAVEETGKEELDNENSDLLQDEIKATETTEGQTDALHDNIYIETDHNETTVQEMDEAVEHNEDDAVVNEIEGVIGKDDGPVEHTPIEELDARATPSPKIEDVVLEEGVEVEEEHGVMITSREKEEETYDVQCDETESITEYPIYDREQLLQKYKEALEERSKIQTLNQQYQHKLAEYFKKKRTDDSGQEIDKNVTDQEQRYLKYMSNLEELQAEEEQQAGNIEIQLEELKERCQEKIDMVEETTDNLMKFKYEVAKTAINSRSGKPLTTKDVNQYQTLEVKKDMEVIAVRLDNIKLKNRLKKREMQLKAKEELAEGLHLIDFEQLKIENQTYNEKIEERNEELLKLRKKITTTVQVLTHLKEKLQFVQGENGDQRLKLKDIEVTVAQRRDVLTRMKQVRDALRIDNNKLKHKSGLLGNAPLLKDFEVKTDEAEELKSRIQNLKEEHVELSMALNSIKKKIEKTKSINTM